MLVQLDADHPGFRDTTYRQRRGEIAELALRFRPGDPIPRIRYTDSEHEVWQTVSRALDDAHARYACQAYLECVDRISLDKAHIPQLDDVNCRLAKLGGFRMHPVAGFISPRAFMQPLARGVFLSTQYVRHHSAPLYTPEPDIVHELIGHAVTLIHPQFEALNKLFGEAAARAPDAMIEALTRAYWYTLEFGAVRERSAVKAYGAGLLSSWGELVRFADKADLRPLDFAEIARTPFEPTQYQDIIFVANSLSDVRLQFVDWLAREGLGQPGRQ